MDKRWPKLSVIMPVYNCDEYVGEAVSSVLNQTFTDFEFIIIDDASTDGTVSVIKSFKDSRINLIEKPQNTGYTSSLNYGLKIAKGNYIARMDGDDISLPERFAKQLAFMDIHQDVIVCGTYYYLIGSDKIKSLPSNHEDIKIRLLTRTCFGHSTVMIRKSVLDTYSITYDITKEPAEDYDLWTRLMGFGKFHNLTEPLLKYRIHESQVSIKKYKQKFESYYIIKYNLLNNLNAPLTKEEKTLLWSVISRQQIAFQNFEVYKSLKSKLVKTNIERQFFKFSGFTTYFKEMDILVCKDYFLNRKKYFPNIIYHYFKLIKEFDYKLSFKDSWKLLLKSLIFHSK